MDVKGNRNTEDQNDTPLMRWIMKVENING